MSDTELKDLRRQRGSIKARLTNFKNYLSEFRYEDPSISKQQFLELKLRLGKIESLFNDYDHVQNKIELLDSAEEINSDRDVTESLFYTQISVAQQLISKSNEEQDFESIHSHSHVEKNIKNIKLPTIKLPNFDGNFNKWLEFHDTFNSLIHTNPALNEINKFQYLKLSLTGQAASVIEALEISTLNYPVAWKLVCDRYNNKRQLVHNHLVSLMNIPTVKNNETSLRALVDHISKHMRALTSLKEKTENWDTLIIFIFSQKLDSATSTKWEEYRNSLKDTPTLDNFYNFLRNHANVLEMVQASHGDKHNSTKEKTKEKVFHSEKSNKLFVAAACQDNPSKPKARSCLICSKDHLIYYCEQFNNMSINERQAEVNKLKLCSNCLRSGHFVNQCLASPCRFCKRKHNSLLHKPNFSTTKVEGNNSSNPTTSVCNPIALSTSVENQVLLSTAVILLSSNGHQHKVRCLLDCGSQTSFISESLKVKLSIASQATNTISVTGINNMKCAALEYCNITIKSRTNSYSKNIKAFVIPQITSSLPNSKVDVSTLNLPGNITLADPTFYNPSQIDLLLGADIFWEVICPTNQIKLGNSNQPVLQNSQFGWLVVGPIMCPNYVPSKEIQCNFSQAIRQQLKQFWELEELPETPKLTAEERACEDHFVQHTRRLEDGRFCVTLPLRDKPELLGDSHARAKHCLYSLEKRFKRQPDIKEQYVNFINEYASLGHLSVVDQPDPVNLLPHHPVLRSQSETTKCRVVFNASSKTESGLSLNDLLMVGPTVQDDIFSILIRFRQHTFVVTGDIEKMYRQILVEESQRYLQVILWRENEEEPMKYLQLNTVTYGTSSAPFLSTRCLIQLSQECDDLLIKEIMAHDFYVDDLITGANDESTLAEIYQQIIAKLESACFNLRKVKSNSKKFIDSISNSSNSEQENFKIISSPSHALGIEWNPNTDKILMVSSKLYDCNNDTPFTKRSILSLTSSLFDPLGLLSCCTIVCKIILQMLWSEKLSWDDEIPANINKIWRDFIDNVDHLQTIDIPRNVCCANPVTIELHSFSDASMKAYAGCVYVRSTDALGNCTVRLLTARAKVAPLKTTTIPKLELCGALLVARLCDKACKALRCNISNKYYWSDSKIVLGWLSTPPHKLQTFVANRVVSINELCKDSKWLYVPTSQNPADIASRGIFPNEIKSLSLWWQGPIFICNGEASWPSQVGSYTTLPEMRVNAACVNETQSSSCVINIKNYSSFSKLRRIVAYLFRFYNNVKNPKNNNKQMLTVEELEYAETKLVWISQQESFPNFEKQCKVAPLISLSPFIDDDGLMRVGGRLENSPFDYNKKHPAIIDSNHHLANLLFNYYHTLYLHAGPQLLLSLIREKYWPVRGRALARKVFRSCVLCRRMRGAVAQQIMGNLPSPRLTPGYPFEVVGTDFAGPFLYSNKIGRGATLLKCYLCVFVCFKTKALHLELVSGLSTEAFILAFRRFISRRGKPREIWCDNGTNFVGASRELGSFLTSNSNFVSEPFVEEGIAFKFIPAYSPNFGGLHEAAVKSAKYHLKRAVGAYHFSFEELTTLLTQIEAILNSRPLSPLSSIPQDLSFLTPGHFLIGRPLTSLPAPDLLEVPGSRLHRYARVEQARQHFWRRWSAEYICELQQRTKWQKRHPNLSPGQLVLIKQEATPPLKWPLGKIEAVFPGSDGACRVADILTSKGIVRRAVNRICPLLEDY